MAGSKETNSLKNPEKPKGQQNSHQEVPDGPQMEKKGTASSAKSQDKPQQPKKHETSHSPHQPSSRNFWLIISLLSIVIAGVAFVAVNGSAKAAVVDLYKTRMHSHVLTAAEFLSVDVSGFTECFEDDRLAASEPPPSEKPGEGQQKAEHTQEPKDKESVKSEKDFGKNAPQQPAKQSEKTAEKPVVQDIEMKSTPKSESGSEYKEIGQKVKTNGEAPDASSAMPSDSADKLGGKGSSKSDDDILPPRNSKPQDSYTKLGITNADDYKIRKKLDDADNLLQKGQLEDALQKFDSILRKHPNSPRAIVGKAEVLDQLGEKTGSNNLIEQSISILKQVLALQDVPMELMKMAGRTLADRQHFRGLGHDSAKTLKILVDRYPDDIQLQRELGVSYLMVAKNNEAKEIFRKILVSHPNDGFSLVHLGYIYGTSSRNPAKAVPLLQAGIESGEPGTQDSLFYTYLGRNLQQLGRMEEARKVYQRGAEKGLFLSADQRSPNNVNSLTGRPWWTPEQTGYQKYLKLLEKNWKVIRDEGLAQLNSETNDFRPVDENLREKGDWKLLTMYYLGRRKSKVCEKVPRTCELVDQIEPAATCSMGHIKFSALQPGVHIWPHCGPTNSRIRAHLGLVVPEGARIRVTNETRTWKEGKVIILDDSFEHEVWNDGNSTRLVLIVDFWHPELSDSEKHSLSAI